MSQGWFGNKNSQKIDTSDKVEKKELNIWSQRQQVDIPDIDEEGLEEEEEEEEEVNAPAIVSMKLDNILELRRKVNPNTVNEIDDEIDLGILTDVLAPPEDIKEKNELWEFQILKNEISATLTNIYGEAKPINS